MRTIAKLAGPLNWPRAVRRRARGGGASLPRFFLFTDQHRLADPTPLLPRLPRGAAVVLRHGDAAELARLARGIVPRAHALGLKVLLAGDARLALKLKCDGVHLSEARARCGPPRPVALPPGFLITAAAHGPRGLWRAARAGADLAFLSPVFATPSHPEARALGLLRFARMARLSPLPVAALGGVTAAGGRRLRLGPAFGLAAIGAWRD